MIGYQCQHCNRVCCWECSTPDDSIETIKTIGNRFCDADACIDEDARTNGIAVVRTFEAHARRKIDSRPCAHRPRSIPPEVAKRNYDAPGTPLVSKVPLDELEWLAHHWGTSIRVIDEAMATLESVCESPLNRALVDALLPVALGKK